VRTAVQINTVMPSNHPDKSVDKKNVVDSCVVWLQSCVDVAAVTAALLQRRDDLRTRLVNDMGDAEGGDGPEGDDPFLPDRRADPMIHMTANCLSRDDVKIILDDAGLPCAAVHGTGKTSCSKSCKKWHKGVSVSAILVADKDPFFDMHKNLLTMCLIAEIQVLLDPAVSANASADREAFGIPPGALHLNDLKRCVFLKCIFCVPIATAQCCVCGQCVLPIRHC